jgi:hypothetical protein
MLVDWQKLQGEELTAARDELEEWVWWLRSTYPSSREAIPDCWPAHPDLVQELTALGAWWEDIYDPAAGQVPDPDGKQPAVESEESNGRSAVSWHEALDHAVQRWRANSKCSMTECNLDKQNAELVIEWRRRRATTRRKLERSSEDKSPLLDESRRHIDQAI